MSPFHNSRSLLRGAAPAALGVLAALALACSSSDRTPTQGSSSTSANISGTLVTPSSTAVGWASPQTQTPVAGVRVSVAGTGISSTSNGSGSFALPNVPSGSRQLTFQGAGVNAALDMSVPAAANVTVTIAVAGNSATIVADHSFPQDVQLEGPVTAVASSSLTLKDASRGSTTVTVSDATVIRKGNAPVALSAIQVGWTVHVMAQTQSDGSYLADQIIVQNTHS